MFMRVCIGFSPILATPTSPNILTLRGSAFSVSSAADANYSIKYKKIYTIDPETQIEILLWTR